MAKRRVYRPEGTPTVTRGKPARPTATHGTSGRPTSQSRRSSAAGPSDRRRRFERASAPWLAQMAALPSIVIPAIMGVGLFIGMVIPSPWAAIPLVMIAGFLVWLAALSWPTLSGSSRFFRLLVVVGLLGLSLFKILGRF